MRRSMKKKRNTDSAGLAEALRQAVWEDGRSRYRLGKEAQIDPSIFYEFAAGEVGLNLASAGRLMNVLGYEMRKKEQ